VGNTAGLLPNRPICLPAALLQQSARKLLREGEGFVNLASAVASSTGVFVSPEVLPVAFSHTNRKAEVIMKNFHDREFEKPHVCFARTAEEIMRRNPVSIGKDVTIAEAARCLTDKNISAAPVIDETGRPVGVVSGTDIVRRAKLNDAVDAAYQQETVADIMTPLVFFVRPQTVLLNVIDDLLTCNIHRLFVVDEHEVLIGVISTLDVLRVLQSDAAAQSCVPADSTA
jgi:CBS domain-containing protein